ncbi:MAG: hypothetical protein L0312_08185 [Acidobacteria bacterium]|nr:hypothetical protein [Acidobacteriota bacterium]
MAAELLSVTNEAKFDQFLDKVILEGEKSGRKRRKRAAPEEPEPAQAGGEEGRRKKKRRRKGLGGALKKLAKTALPMAGRLLGSAFGGPLGGAIGGQLGSAAGGLLGKELYGLEAEEEFEAALQFVQLAGEAGKNLAAIPLTAPPEAAIQAAIKAAARKQAPGLLGTGAISTMNGKTNGRWICSGHRIIVLGV